MQNLRYYLDISLSSFQKNENIKANGVVCLLFKRDEILFIRRSELMPTHKGDIAFIGGHLNESESILEGAHREFQEETSLSLEHINFLGYLNPVVTSRFKGIHVCCFEILIEKKKFLSEVRSNGEWEDIFFISYKRFLNQKNWSFSYIRKGDIKKKIYFCDINNSKRNLWGMTASIVFNIFKNKLISDNKS